MAIVSFQKIKNAKGLAARTLLTALGGLASMVAGANHIYHADLQTPKKKRRPRTVSYGKNLLAHFAEKGINWHTKNRKN